jgi:arylsulfatase
MLRKGNWKLLNNIRPLDPKNFELYNLETDLGEQADLRESFPEKYQELLKEWDSFSSRVGVLIPTPQSN